MKRAIAAAATATLLVMVLGVWRLPRGQDAATPEACIDHFYSAMRAGDVDAYLNCMSEELRGAMRASRPFADADREAAARFLRAESRGIKGRALLGHLTEWSGTDRVRLVVDCVFEGRPWEYHRYRLCRERGAWRIEAREAVEPHEPLVPYGAPAFGPGESSGETAAP